MLDPLLIFLELFGGLLIGLIEGLVRKRGLMATITNILVATAFGIGAAIAAVMVLNPNWKSALLILYFVPIAGSAIGVMVVLRILRRERWSTIRELLKVAAYFVVAVVVLLGLVEICLYLFFGSYQYSAIRVNDIPATLAGEQMAGAAKVTLAVSTGHAESGTLETASAEDIVAAIPDGSIGRAYRLRIINPSSNVTLTVTAGTGVTLHGTMTIPPNAWRDFSVTPTAPTSVSVQSTGTGVCPPNADPHGCRL